MLSKKSSVILRTINIWIVAKKNSKRQIHFKEVDKLPKRLFSNQIFRLDKKPSWNVSVFIFRHKLCKRSNFFCWPTALHIVCKFLAISKKVNFLWSTSFRGTFISFPIWWGAISQSCHSWTVWDIFECKSKLYIPSMYYKHSKSEFWYIVLSHYKSEKCVVLAFQKVYFLRLKSYIG